MSIYIKQCTKNSGATLNHTEASTTCIRISDQLSNLIIVHERTIGGMGQHVLLFVMVKYHT